MSSTSINQASHSSNSSVNPFARALAEARGNQHNPIPQDGFLSENFGMEDFYNSSRPSSGGSYSDVAPQFAPSQFEDQKRLQEQQQKRERLRAQLHRQINPVETTDIYNAQKQRVDKEVEQLRHELKLMVQEIAEFHKEIEISIMANVPDAGTEGKYHLTFYQKLRAFIQLLRQKIHSARTWATTFNSKKKKKQGKAGLEISGQQYEQTTTVYDRMHHERSTVYSGS